VKNENGMKAFASMSTMARMIEPTRKELCHM